MDCVCDVGGAGEAECEGEAVSDQQGLELEL